MIDRCKRVGGKLVLILSCDWCGLSIDQIAYVVTVIKAADNSPMDSAVSRGHTHWDCLPKWVEYMRGGEDPPILKKKKGVNI